MARIVLGIESTAHTLGIGIFKENEGIISNVYDTYVSPYGYVPRELVEHHQRVFPEVLKKALDIAKIKIKDVDVIGVAQGPGIGSPLKFGVSMANYLASKYKKPIVGVNHGFSHIKITEYTSGIKKDYIAIYISGGNTQILYSKDGFNYEVLGETLDIGIGNLFDNFARELKLFPANGASLEKYGKRRYVKLPYSIKGMNMTFSGLLTAAKRKIGNDDKALAFSLMHNAFAMVLESAERAFHLKKAKAFLACGGVAQSKQFKEMIKKLAEENNAKLALTKDEFNRDNGAMIAYASYLVSKKYGVKKAGEIKAIQNYRVEELEKVIKKR